MQPQYLPLNLPEEEKPRKLLKIPRNLWKNPKKLQQQLDEEERQRKLRLKKPQPQRPSPPQDEDGARLLWRTIWRTPSPNNLPSPELLLPRLGRKRSRKQLQSRRRGGER